MCGFELIDEWGPEKVVCISDRRTEMQGVLVIDNTARGMGKGGTRMAADLSVLEVARLARVMTWKWAAADLYYGGAKAGIRFDPTSPKKEAALRAFVRALHNEIPAEYVFGLDMGLTESDAAIVQDELGDRSGAVGTPAALGGLPYDELGLTGYGVAIAAQAAHEFGGAKLDGARIAIQGFGAVGWAAARRLTELGAHVVAVSTAQGALHDDDGLDVEQLIQRRAEAGDRFVLSAELGTLLPLGEELFVDCDVLVPAARQDVLNADNAPRVKARLIVEGANLPTDAAAQQHFAARGVTVVPDFVANAGGIIAAAYAMDARHSAFRLAAADVYLAIDQRIAASTMNVLTRAADGDVTPHKAGRTLSRERVHEAMALKGRLPR